MYSLLASTWGEKKSRTVLNCINSLKHKFKGEITNKTIKKIKTWTLPKQNVRTDAQTKSAGSGYKNIWQAYIPAKKREDPICGATLNLLLS